MEVKLALLADAANVTAEGKLNILGEFNILWVPTLPFTWPSMQLVVKFEATAGEGPKHKLGIRIVDEDGNPAAPPLDGEIDMGKQARPGMPYRSQLILGIQNATFKQHGTFSFEILIASHNVATIPLYVLPAEERRPSK